MGVRPQEQQHIFLKHSLVLMFIFSLNKHKCICIQFKKYMYIIVLNGYIIHCCPFKCDITHPYFDTDFKVVLLIVCQCLFFSFFLLPLADFTGGHFV
ncbi:hypothetical protein KUCAC02_020740 [Chaenocephalus aceratus]|uniref:Uncharacterized protein n=1 Tax=Chaenocephalus aceratus TaxID=36190 RepID=A0ACB9XFE9_CHAAC|nr:hypothetical protein KUCAC02_020740 [Chaenocephalus aceratus]